MAIATDVLFPWSEAYTVNIGIIDTQHKNLVNIINELHHAMIAGKAKQDLGTILGSLVKYTQIHFKTEENLMETRGYPDYPDHKTKHEQLSRTVLDFQSKFQRNELGLTIDVMEFLKDWLGKHILGIDKKYTAFLNSQGVR